MLSIEPIPIFSDNYVWLIMCSQTSNAYVVDPGEAQSVIDTLTAKQLTLKGVLLTHWHPDHIGGLEALQQHYKGQLAIVGPNTSRIPRVNQIVAEGTSISLLSAQFKVMEVPGHTMDHVAYYSQALKILFCGDALFAAGCGRMFEGTPKIMHQSLQRFSNLPDNTRVYCAHEYTQSNLKFAKAVEPNNQNIALRIREVDKLREQLKNTLPSTIGLEKKTNPFLRTHINDLKTTLKSKHLECSPDWKAFESLRAWKDSF